MFKACIFLSSAFLAVAVWGETNHRLAYNNPGLTVDLGVGLWANPLPMDYDGDGDYDLVVSCADKPHTGIYLFENDGSGVFLPAVQLSSHVYSKNMGVSETPRGTFVTCAGDVRRVWTDFKNGTDSPWTEIPFKQDFYAGRQNLWRYGDFDGDGIDDLYFGVGDWREYGWDDAFNEKGEWTAGLLHGYVYWAKNIGSNEKPVYQASQKVEPIDVYGQPSPCLIDWDGDGDLDFLCGEFLDRISFFENVGTRTEPEYAAGRFLTLNDNVMHLELQMALLASVDWDHDGDPDLISGKEDGRVVFIENLGGGTIAAPVYFQQRADRIKSGALVTPDCVDWDDDGDMDIVTGNTAGFVEFIENLGGKWAPPVRLTADGQVIRPQAGFDGSIQGPCEAKWGYSVPDVADWDGDGLKDLVLNSIRGEIIWYKNIGKPGAPKLTGPFGVKVAWPEEDAAPKPPWNWRNPDPNELVVQWRTRPNVIDLDSDGLPDLVALDHEGYLAWYRKRVDGQLEAGQRIFRMAEGEPCVFNNNAEPVFSDQNKDGINDLTQSTVNGETIYIGRTSSYGTEKRRYYLRTPTENLEGKKFAGGGNTENRLRANSGWAGQSGRCKYLLTDWDGDGDLDLLVNSKNIAYFENVGKKGEYVFIAKGNLLPVLLAGHTTCPAVFDLTGEGVPDLLIGAEDGFFHVYPRRSWTDLCGEK